MTEVAARAERAEVRADEMAARAEEMAIRGDAAAHAGVSAELTVARAESEATAAQLSAVVAELESALAADGSTPRAVADVQRELATARAELAEALAFAEELTRANADLREQVASQALRAEAEAADARARLLDTQGSLARLQGAVERGADRDATAPVPSPMSANAATEVVDALSLDASRSLSAIFGLARALSTHRQSGEDGRLLKQLMTQAKRMEQVIGDILDADQLTRGEPVLQRRSTEIDTLIRRVVREFPFANDRMFDVSVETATIQVDPARVERLIDDLLTGAVAHTGPGDTISLRLERAPDGVLISVEDGKRADGDEAAGTAAAFQARLHGGWTRTRTLSDGTGVVQAFLPCVRVGSEGNDAEAEATAAFG